MDKTNNQTIFKVVKRECPFVQVDKGMVNDKRLHLKTKGLLLYLLSKPDNWTVRQSDITKNSADGKDAVISAIKEAEKYGYMKKLPQIKDDTTGQFLPATIEVYEIPEDTRSGFSDMGKSVSKRPVADFPLTETRIRKPVNGKPDTTNIYNNNIEDTNKDTNNSEGEPSDERDDLKESPAKEFSQEVENLAFGYETYYKRFAPKLYEIVIGSKDDEEQGKLRNSWLDTFDKLLRIDKHTQEKIQMVIRELFTGQFYDFWINKRNFQSATKFRQNVKSIIDQRVKYFDWFLMKMGHEEPELKPAPSGDDENYFMPKEIDMKKYDEVN